jgi:hypothetical protein
LTTFSRVSRWFYISIALLMILLNVVAFGPSIIDSSSRNVPLPFTPLVTAHVVVSVAWLLLFLTQATLVATARASLHRRLGAFGGVLMAAFVATGSYTIIAEARRGFDLSGDISRLPPQPGADTLAAEVSLLFFLLTFAVWPGPRCGSAVVRPSTNA